MTEEQIRVIRELRNEGYAVSMFTPEELGDVAFWDIEDVMVAAGSEAIELLKEQDSEENDNGEA